MASAMVEKQMWCVACLAIHYQMLAPACSIALLG
jgi:hypothetical protein